MNGNNFRKCLDTSHEYANAPWWKEVYEAAFPGCTVTDLHEDGPAQRWGIDRRISRPSSGSTFTVDEKVRTEDYPDILLEAYSVWCSGSTHPDKHRCDDNNPNGQCRNGRTEGWIFTGQADYLAYAFIPSRRCYLLPMSNLKQIWRKQGRGWWTKARRREDGFYMANAENVNDYGRVLYYTRSVCVPIPILLDSIRDNLIVEWSEK